jgi:hypothetical protein
MFGVLGRQESALVVVEPPGQVRVRRVFEIDNCVYVAVEKAVLKELGSFVSQAGKFEAWITIERSFVKAAKERGRGGPVETMIVVENSDPHEFICKWKTIQLASIRVLIASPFENKGELPVCGHDVVASELRILTQTEIRAQNVTVSYCKRKRLAIQSVLNITFLAAF